MASTASVGFDQWQWRTGNTVNLKFRTVRFKFRSRNLCYWVVVTVKDRRSLLRNRGSLSCGAIRHQHSAVRLIHRQRKEERNLFQIQNDSSLHQLLRMLHRKNWRLDLGRLGHLFRRNWPHFWLHWLWSLHVSTFWHESQFGVFDTLFKISILSKNSISTNPQHFHEFFTKIFDNFSREIKVVSC